MKVYRNNGITVRIASDEMSALLSISKKGIDFPSRDALGTALQEAGVCFGVDQKLLSSVLQARERVHELIIAEGAWPVDCQADELIWAIDILNQTRPRINMDGKADFKQLNQFQAVAPGDDLVALLPGKPGQPGQTVTGKVVPAQGVYKALRLPAGKNTRVSEDGVTLFAAIEGVAMLRDNLVVVDNVFHIKGDVDFNTGNVNYQGSVIIDGDVRSGFRVEATENIYIRGSVEAAEIYSKNGCIVIQNGILGRHRAKILAGDGLECGFIQDAIASVKNDVAIKHYAINSTITSGGKVVLVEHEGLIRGGKTVAEKGIEVLTAGSDKNILTELFLTRSDVGTEHSKLWQSKIRLAEEYQILDKHKKRLEFLNLLQQRLGSISEERELEVGQLKEQLIRLEQQVEKLRQESEQLAHEVATETPEQAVHIHQRLYRKVTVTIGHKKYFSKSARGGVRIYRQGDEMLIDQVSKSKDHDHE